MRVIPCLATLLLSIGQTFAARADGQTKVLVVYAGDQYNQIKKVADSIGDGATSIGADVKVVEVASVNYKRDVAEWADAVMIGSGVFNGNAAPRLLSFVNSFDFMDDLSTMVCGSFATGGSGVAGLEATLSEMNRGMKMFGMISVGGTSWRNSEGTGVVTSGDQSIDHEESSLQMAFDHGARVAQVAGNMKRAPSVPGGIDAPNEHVTALLDSVTTSLGRAHWTHETKLYATCESYCRGWMAAVGCGTCSTDAFSGGAFFDHMCVHPGPTGTGLLCRMDPDTFEPTGESCCGVGGPCEIPQPQPSDVNETGQWPGGCCWGGTCDKCPGGSPLSDTFPLLNDTRTQPENRRWFDYDTNTCMQGVPPTLAVTVAESVDKRLV